MKKIIFIYTVACMFAAVIVQKTFCQGLSNSADINIEAAAAAASDRGSALPVNTATNYRNNINIKAVRNFIRDFKDAKDVAWIIANDGGYAARFISDSIQTMVAYDRKGSWNYTLKKCAESRMPLDVRAMVKSTYFDYYIAEVQEIRLPHERSDIIYQILIKNADNFKILQIRNKQMETISDYTRP